VPAEQPVELFFFQRVFHRLCMQNDYRKRLAEEAKVAASTYGHPSNADLLQPCPTASPLELADGLENAESSIPLVEFERAMVRLQRVICDNRHEHDVSRYDFNGDGSVSWFEFCLLWQDRGICAWLSPAERIFLTLEDASLSKLGRLVSILVFAAILVSIVTFVVSTVPHPSLQELCRLPFEAGFDESCRPSAKPIFRRIDFYCVMFFTFEYSLRLVLSAVVRGELCDREKTKLLKWVTSDEVVVIPGRLRRAFEFMIAPSNLVDLFAIMPWYLEEFSDGGKQNAILKLIRLTRVIRAFRLGRRLEAVIIIARSLKRSLRALSVLMLNLLLGMLIFGSLLYIAEQGEWDPEKQYFVREVDRVWNDDMQVWQRVMARSPFDSIPACFWWAVVTATTVGYGDESSTPTTTSGKLVAGVTMVWALCVLALPIGVIGGNFEKVWAQYDEEKREEVSMMKRQDAIYAQSLGLLDPLHCARTVVFEVWHDSGLQRADGRGNQAEFLGEAECILDFTPLHSVIDRSVSLPLRRNPSRSQKHVRGQLTFDYSWLPAEGLPQEALLAGSFKVNSIRAEGLVGVDWADGVADPYCVIVMQPRSSEDGRPAREAHRTPTAYGTTCPSWSCAFDFRFCWTRSGADVAFRAGMRRALAEAEMAPDPTMRPQVTVAPSATPSPTHASVCPAWRVTEVTPIPPDVEEPELEFAQSRTSIASSAETEEIPDPTTDDHYLRPRHRPNSQRCLTEFAMPELLGDVDKLKRLMPKLQADVGRVCEDLDRIFSALQRA